MTKVKGTGPILIAKFDGPCKKRFTNINSTKNVVLLSIKGNEYCTGDYLGAMITSSILVHQFSTLLIADEIYWHNIIKRMDVTSEDEVELKKEATLLGAEFFNNHLKQFLAPLKMNVDEFIQQYGDKSYIEQMQVINELAIKNSLGYEVVCWSEWMKRAPSSYQDNQNKLAQVYLSEPLLKDAVDANVVNYSKRHSQEGNVDLIKFRSEGYLREESPGVMWLAAHLGYNFISYPGSMPKSFQATKDYFVINSTQSKSLVDGALEKSLFIKSEKPELLANLLEVNFQRSKEPNLSPVTTNDVSSTVTPSTEISSKNTTRASGNSHQFFSSASNKSFSSESLVSMTLSLLHDPTTPTEKCALFMVGIFPENSIEKYPTDIKNYLNMVALGVLHDQDTPIEKGTAFVRDFLSQLGSKSNEIKKEESFSHEFTTSSNSVQRSNYG